MFEVEASSMSPERFRSVLAPERYEQFERGMHSYRTRPHRCTSIS
jgi:hypothetical protein